jgi:hypothetical protein
MGITIDGAEASVGCKGLGAELRHGDWAYQHERDIEQEGVHPCLVYSRIYIYIYITNFMMWSEKRKGIRTTAGTGRGTQTRLSIGTRHSHSPGQSGCCWGMVRVGSPRGSLLRFRWDYNIIYIYNSIHVQPPDEWDDAEYDTQEHLEDVKYGACVHIL